MGICVYLFYVCFLVIRIGIILSLTSLYVLSLGICVCFLGSMIISGILFIYYFYDDFYFVCLSLALCDNGLSLTYDNPFFIFYVFVLGYGYIILVIWGFLYHRTGIYLFDFFFICVFWDPNVCDYIILIL